MKHLDNLVTESIDVSSGRDHLIAVSKKTSQKLLSKLCNYQPTRQPIATVYGMAIKASGNDTNNTESTDVFIDHSTAVTYTAPDFDELAEYQVGDKFNLDRIAFEVIDNTDFPLVLDSTKAFDMALDGKLRIICEAPIQAVPQQSEFVLTRWRSEVGARLIKFDSSVELLEDFEKVGGDTSYLVDGVLSTVVSESINSDIICTLIGISKKESPLDLSGFSDSYKKGRELITQALLMASDIKKSTTAVPNILLCTPAIEALLKSSGQVISNEFSYIEGTDLEIVCDTKSPVNYMMILCSGGTMIEPSSLYFSPLLIGEGDSEDGIEMLFNRESKGMTPSYGAMVRYCLTIAQPNNDDQVTSIDWSQHSGTSKYTSLSKVIL